MLMYPSISVEDLMRVSSSFGSNLKIWRFFTSPKDDTEVSIAPVDLRSFSGFDVRECYIVLHVYEMGELNAESLLSPRITSGIFRNLEYCPLLVLFIYIYTYFLLASSNLDEYW